LEGNIEVNVQRVENNNLIGDISVYIVKSGDVFWIDPYINHKFIPKSFSKWINALSEPLDNENPDIHRVSCNSV